MALQWTTLGEGQAYNLTVADLHTYYVLAGETPVLVHNCDPSLDIGGGSFPNTDVRSIVRTPEGTISVNPNAAHGPTVVGRSQQLPFQDSVFGRVTMNHFPADQLDAATLSEAARVLKPGGSLSITTGRLADVGGIVDRLSNLGFTTTVGRVEGGLPWIRGILG